MSRTAAIIQARTGSSRLPNKIFSDLSGNPLIWHIVQRLRDVTGLDSVIIATTTHSGDDKIADFSRDLGIKCFRGDEKDVLSRYIGAADLFKIDNIIRVTGDSPLICPNTIAEMIKSATSNKLDYVSFDPDSNHVFEGFELVTLDALKNVFDISNENYVREHVTIYIRENPHEFKTSFLPVKNHHLKSRFPFQFKLSVDTKFDLDFMRYIYNKLSKDELIINFDEALDLIEKDLKLQSYIKLPTHKNLKTSSIRFGFVADKMHPEGLLLAKVLRDHFHYGIYIFTTELDNFGEDEGFNVIHIKNYDDIDKLKEDHRIDFLISYK